MEHSIYDNGSINTEMMRVSQQQQQQSRVLQQRWWWSWHRRVGGIRGCLQPIREKKRHKLPPAYHSYVIISPSSPLLCPLRGFHGNLFRLGRPETEQHIKSGNRKAVQRWQGWRGSTKMNEHNGHFRISPIGQGVMKSAHAQGMAGRPLLCHQG